MLRSLKDMLKCTLLAKDGEFGTVDDLFLDDKNLAVRYIVVETGEWLPDHKLLIPLAAFSQTDWIDGLLPMPHTREQVMRKLVRGSLGRYSRFGDGL
jgi:hypothetical protein